MTEITLDRTVRRRKSYADRTRYDRRIAKAYNGAFSNVLGHDFRIDEKTGRKSASSRGTIGAARRKSAAGCSTTAPSRSRTPSSISATASCAG